ncbi:RagB/SusD family nutrient uptake outer membrane protein [Mucilaginibacter aquaedulcis]|uniref:RagB/SusD family nutrient uptake outer membrane protein n=1 Tax=Mucilaginibacter aquaedulcis TaxID=1187081 RepID=UPI0025B4CD6F|nr:RagB/SusD family nutrient uptake outer membrane protein [Mucilaginibacter aquaedulcis]MDN3547779.1 RagB/SusD family nutrient uptake outer membrane protein [Mucilaginibacter aquaedulcis]
MKNIIIIFIAAVICLTSCKKLDVTPPDKLSTTIFWKTPADADLALAGIYATLYAQSGQISEYAPMWWENFSDNSYSQNNQGGAQQSLIAGLTPTIGGFPTDNGNSLYINAYISIAASNSFLANVSKVLTGDKLNQYKGEAYFLRAFNYFLLAETYGNVPLITADPLTIDFKNKVSKSSRADVLKQVESDLDQAISSLPDNKYTTGHVVKASAQGIKVRVLLFEKKYADAATLAKAIIDGGLFSLSNNYAGNFYKPDQRSSPEVMFSVQFQAPAVPHPFAITTAIIGTGYKDLQGTQDMINEYEPNDPRKTMTFFFPGDTQAQGWPFPNTVGTPGVNNWTPGFYPGKKWLDPKNIDPQPGILDDQDYVWLRYADVKLMYAEAQNESSGPDASVYQQVNEVRARPGVNMPSLPGNLSQADMRTRIMHERRVELALEGLRYFDLRRWGLAKQKLNGFIQNPLTPAVKTIYKDNFEFWPLPQNEIDRNTPALVQNDGY